MNYIENYIEDYIEKNGTGNNHNLYALVNVIFHVLTIFNVTNAERYKKCSTGVAVAQLAGGLQVFFFLTNIVELGV